MLLLSSLLTIVLIDVPLLGTTIIGASRFIAVYDEYAKAPEVTRQRLYLETMERVLGDIDKVIIDEASGGQGVVPYLPLNQLTSGGSNQ